jgi:tetratricopeptide (TPR) repeat protein
VLTFRPRVAVLLAAILCVVSVRAAAQKDAFRDALIGFHAALSGDYGDEGPLVAGNLERMASALAAWDEAIRGAEQNLRPRLASASLRERVQVHTTLAQLYRERGRHADAIRELDAAIQVDAHRGTLHVFRGLVLETLGRDADAVGGFRRAWELDQDDPISAYLLASRRATRAGPDETTPQAARLLKAHERRLTSVPGDRHIPLFAELALVPDGAAATPVFSPALYAEGFTRVAEGRYHEAIASFRTAVARDPLVAGARAWPERFQTGISRLRDGDAEGAIPHLEAAAGSAPRSPEIHRILAAAYGESGNDATSIEHLETAVNLNRDDERASVALGRALAHAGQVDRAERVLVDTIGRLPQSTDAHSALADLYENSGRGRSAIHELEVVASFTVPAGKGALYYRLADLQHRHLEYERVIEPLRRRTRLNPNDARGHTDLGLAYTRVGRTNDALVELVTASLLGPDDPETLTAIGQMHFDAGDYVAAETVLRRAIAIAPTLIQARYLIGQTLARLGRTKEGQEQLAEFDSLRAAANEDARRAFEIDMLRQAAARATAAGRHEEAVAAWQTIVEREPKRPEHRIALAGALSAAGRPELAVGHLETAASFDNADKEVYRLLAEHYATLGRRSESATARQTYQRLLQEQRRGR